MVMKVCPKCNNTNIKVGEIYRVGDKIGFIKFLPFFQKKLIPRPVNILSFACLNCGYTETYINENDLTILNKMEFKQ